MKKTTILLLTLIMTLLLCACGSAKATEPAPTTAPTAEPKPTPTAAPTEAPAPTSSAKPISPEVQQLEAQNKKVWSEMHDREYMEGRLVIPSAGINVALLSWGQEPAGDYDQDKIIELVRQAVVDDPDSALLYNDDPVANIIADHSTQDFSALSNVKVGDKAYMLSGDRIVTLTCNFVSDGVNTGYGITDKDGGWNHNTDYVCYTCMEDWTHILMVGFEMTDEDFFDMAWIDVGEPKSSNSGVVTTMSLPASAAPNNAAAASAAPAPAATAVPTAAVTATPKPSETPAPQPARQQAPAEPAYNDYVVPGYDIYADNNYYGSPINNTGDFGYTGSDSGDGYLG